MRERATCLTLCRITDVSDSRNDHNVNRCDSDLSLSGRLFLEVYGIVRHLPIPFIALCSVWSIHRSASVCHNLPPGRLTTSKAYSIPVPSGPPVPMEVVVHSTYEQSQTPQTSRHSSFMIGEGLLQDKSTGLGLVDDVESLNAGPMTKQV